MSVPGLFCRMERRMAVLKDAERRGAGIAVSFSGSIGMDSDGFLFPCANETGEMRVDLVVGSDVQRG